MARHFILRGYPYYPYLVMICRLCICFFSIEPLRPNPLPVSLTYHTSIALSKPPFIELSGDFRPALELRTFLLTPFIFQTILERVRACSIVSSLPLRQNLVPSSVSHPLPNMPPRITIHNFLWHRPLHVTCILNSTSTNISDGISWFLCFSLYVG